ncbi:MAG TPA: hypothetical protein VMT23_00825 [Candidatus Binatia bacterium]|nr:hypothetical protein [Candidatus Binatia bacterium]
MFLGLSKIKRILPLALIAVLLLAISPSVFAFTNLIQRSVTIGTSIASANTTHTFSFVFPITENVGSIVFEYCTDPIDSIPCDNPPGSDVSGAVLASQAGETGFAIVSQSTNQIVLGRTPSVVGNQANTYEFTNVINPSNLGPFFIRISAYPNSDGSGPLLSFSSVAASINQTININAEVPDILYFCAAVIIPTNCSDASGDFIEFGTLTTDRTKFGASQFFVGSNAVNGYTVSTNGPTMTSGTDQITAASSPDISRIGTSQFGLNLRANSVPLIGADNVGGTGLPTANYSIINKYAYQDGGVVAASTTRSTTELYTVSYIVNVNSAQPPGVYNTTITYLCVASF